MLYGLNGLPGKQEVSHLPTDTAGVRIVFRSYDQAQSPTGSKELVNYKTLFSVKDYFNIIAYFVLVDKGPTTQTTTDPHITTLAPLTARSLLVTVLISAGTKWSGYSISCDKHQCLPALAWRVES